jgi:D-galactarolactone cycloisomerase
MKIKSVQGIPFHQERDAAQSIGTAGSPARLLPGESPYRWAEHYPVIYSRRFETALVRIELDSGEVGWGEAQAPVAPEVACAVVNRILGPILEGREFGGSVAEIESLWWTMYSAMRVRGQTGGFMLDGIAGVDLALWDLAGKLAKLPVSALIGRIRNTVPAYLSGLPGGTPEGVRPWVDAGFTHVKIFHDSALERLLENFDIVRSLLPAAGHVAVDALWRLTPESARELAPKLAVRSALWLEAPLQPESATEHGHLAAAIATPLALGESYRTVFELTPFFHAKAMQIVQPDLGRTGITEGLRIARAAAERGLQIVPHISIALGPQLAAAIHFAASVPNCPMLEFNPNVLSIANKILEAPISLKDAAYIVPDAPGLSVTMRL